MRRQHRQRPGRSSTATTPAIADVLDRLVPAPAPPGADRLEQFVLIQIFDQSWKDHLYAMDMLKGGVGLAALPSKDPRIVYKKEGYEYFQQMMAGVRDKVTDLIFRARVVGPTQARSAYRETAAVHEEAGGYGVAENAAPTATGAGSQPHSQQAQAAKARRRQSRSSARSPRSAATIRAPAAAERSTRSASGRNRRVMVLTGLSHG